MIIDTHLHLIDKSALDYPWLGGVPALDRDFLFATYRTQAERCGVSAALHMEVDVAPDAMQAETDHVQETAVQSGGFIKGAIASCRPEEPGFADYLERQRGNPFVKGFRRVLHVVPDDLSEGALFRENIRRLAGTGLTFDLCTLPHQIDKAIALVDLAPDVQFILDHCGVPDIKSGALGSWQKGIADIARRPNVTAKFPASWPMQTRRTGPSKRSGPMWNTLSGHSAGIASSGAATGRSARLRALSMPGFRHGLRPPTPCSKDAATTRRRVFCHSMRAASGSFKPTTCLLPCPSS